MEIWKPTPLCYGYLEVSSIGRVRSTERKVLVTVNSRTRNRTIKSKILSPWITKHGYHAISIVINDKRPKFLVHRLVASAFVDGFDENLTINHKDGVKLNNVPSNLEWVSLERNSEHEWETKLVNLSGENHPFHILTVDQVKEILLRKSLGEKVVSIHKDFRDVSISCLYKLCQGKNWKRALKSQQEANWL